MYIYEDPDKWINEAKMIDADGHCCFSYTRRRATPEEYKENRRKRLTKELEEARATVSKIERELNIV